MVALLFTATAQAQVAPSPSIVVEKTVYEGHDDGAGCEGDELVQGALGDAVTYCFVVTNDGDTTLAPVSVVDADLEVDETDMTVVAGDLTSMAPGDTATLALEHTIEDDLTNTVAVSGIPVDGNGDPLVGVGPATAEDTAEVDLLAPSLSLAKTVYRGHDDGVGCPGSEEVSGPAEDEVTYCFEVTNDGDSTLAPVTVTDADLSIDDSDMTVSAGDLTSMAAGDTATLFYETSIDGDLTNTATASGTLVDDTGDPVVGADPVTDDDTAQVDEVDLALTILTEALDPLTGDYLDADDDDDTIGSNDPRPATYRSGETATFRFTVTNTGEAEIAEVVVDAPSCDETPDLVAGDDGDADVLDVDESWELSCDVADLTSGMTMSATVTGDVDGEEPDGSGESEAAEVQVAAIAVEKTVLDPASGDFQDSVLLETGTDATFQIVVTNDGEVPLGGVEVSDPLVSDCNHDFTDALAPGDSFAAYTCVLGDITEGFVNTAAVVGTPVDDLGDAVGENVVDESMAVVDLSAGLETTDLAITKDLADIDQSSGAATWAIGVTNEGTLTATEPIVVTDELPGALGYRNAGGADWTCEYDEPVVTCATDLDLEPGETTWLSIETYVLADPGESVMNVAGVDESGDIDTSNNTDAAALAVDSQGNIVPVVPTSIDATNNLPRTGADAARLVAVAALLMLTGVALRRAARRRTVA